MSRLYALHPDLLSQQQRKVYDDIASGPRGEVGGPLAVWLRSPDLADRAQRLGEFVRFNSSIPPVLSELAILVTARYWSAQYEWFMHEPFALKAGLKPEVVASIREKRVPVFDSPEEKLVYDFAINLHDKHSIDACLYQYAVETLGETCVVDLVGILGYYVLVSMTLNVFEVDIPDGAVPSLKN